MREKIELNILNAEEENVNTIMFIAWVFFIAIKELARIEHCEQIVKLSAGIKWETAFK